MNEPLKLGASVEAGGKVFRRFMYGNAGSHCWYGFTNGMPVSWENICSLGEPREVIGGDTGS